MFGRILLLLNSTSCAQDVVAIGQALAARFGSSLLLVHVTGAPSSWPDNATAEKWLALQAASLRAEGYSVDILVRDGEIADALAKTAEEQRVDLIVLGWQRWNQELRSPVLGSPDSSAQMIARAAVPFLVISPNVDTAAALRFLSDAEHTRRAIAVALDGGEIAERALPIAVQIARGLGQHLHLVRVVPQMAPETAAGATSAIWRMAIQTVFADVHTAHEYLAEVRRTIVATTPVHVQKRVPIGDTVEKLLEAARPTEVGLLVLTMHGHGTLAYTSKGNGITALLYGACVPLLIVPATTYNQSQRQPSMEHKLGAADDGVKD